MTYRQDGKIKVLFVAANPVTTKRLKLDEEIRAIKEKIRAAEHRDLVELIPILAARPDDLLQSLNEHKPQIVHFSAHGDPSGEIILVDDRGLPKAVSTWALTDLFKTLKDNIRIVVLNACYSQLQARAITEAIDGAIGIDNTIKDRDAIIFAASFYRAIGFGRSVQEAFDQSNAALSLQGNTQGNRPELLVKAGVDASRIFVIPDLARTEGRRFLMQGKNALSQRDYISASPALEKAIETLSNEELPQELARAKYFLAIAQLKGRRPFSLPKSTMDTISNLIFSAITLHSSSSYILTLALFKMDFARNGFSNFAREAQQLLNTARPIAQTPEDGENLTILFSCQPDLKHDLINL